MICRSKGGTMKSAETKRLEAEFVESFDKPVNKTAFLFFDWVAQKRYPKNQKRQGLYRSFIGKRFSEYAGKTGEQRTWRKAAEWLSARSGEIYAAFRGGLALGADK